jgi:hypothetical protein
MNGARAAILVVWLALPLVWLKLLYSNGRPSSLVLLAGATLIGLSVVLGRALLRLDEREAGRDGDRR